MNTIVGKLIKKHWFLLFLIVLVLFLIGLFLFINSQRDTSEKVPQQQINTLPQIRVPRDSLTIIQGNLDNVTLTFTTTLPDVPDNFTLPNYKLDTITPEELSNNLSFKRKITENIYQDERTQSSLTYSPESGLATYFFDSTKHETPEGFGNFDENKINTAAQDFITQKLKLSLNQVQQKPVRYAITDGNHFKELPNKANANYAIVSYLYGAGGDIYWGLQDETPAIELYIDQDYQVIKADFYPVKLQISQNNVVPSLTIEESIQLNATAYYNTIVYEMNKISPEELVSIQVTHISLGKHLDPLTGVVQPMYNVDGIATLTNNRTTDVSFSLPAIRITSN